MHEGHYISGFAHAGFIGWALIGGVFAPQDNELVFNNVSVLSEAEFQAMIASDKVPDVPQFDLTALTPSDETDAAPSLNETDDQQVEIAEPAPPEMLPDEVTLPEPVEPLVVPTPDITAPNVQPPQPQFDTAMLLPDIAEESAPIQANRVAPTPVAPPEQPAVIDDITQEATVPAEDQDALIDVAPEIDQSTAPEAASTEIITEAKKEESKRKISPRPVLRPSNFRPTTPKPAESNLEDILREVTQSAPIEAPKPTAPSGPPLSGGERDAFRIAVQNCWVVDVGSRAANVTVTLAMKMQPDGKVIASSLEMIGFKGGNESDARVAFRSARRAVLRCQKDGYQLPKDKYDHWRDVEITFNPKDMRKR